MVRYDVRKYTQQPECLDKIHNSLACIESKNPYLGGTQCTCCRAKQNNRYESSMRLLRPAKKHNHLFSHFSNHFLRSHKITIAVLKMKVSIVSILLTAAAILGHGNGQNLEVSGRTKIMLHNYITDKPIVS